MSKTLWKRGPPEPLRPWQKGPHIDDLPVEHNTVLDCNIPIVDPRDPLPHTLSIWYLDPAKLRPSK